MNKYTRYAGYFLIGWSSLQLVGFLYNAFPITRMLGNIVVLFIIFGSLALGVSEVIKSRNNHIGHYGGNQKYKWVLPFIPSLLIIAVLFIPLLTGSFIAGEVVKTPYIFKAIYTFIGG